MLQRLYRALKLFRCYQDVTAFRPDGISTALDFCMSRIIQPLQIRQELRQLVELVAERRPRNVLEIGTAHGGTLFLWCQFADPRAKIVSLDLPDGAFGGGYSWKKILMYKAFAKPSQDLRLLRGDSHSKEMIERVEHIFPEGIDFLFIDGDHTYEGVKRDFEIYSPLVRNGFIAFHDIVPHAPERNCGVDRLWLELRREYPHREIVDNWQQGWAGIGVLMPDSPVNPSQPVTAPPINTQG